LEEAAEMLKERRMPLQEADPNGSESPEGAEVK